VVAGHQKLFDKARVIPIDSHRTRAHPRERPSRRRSTRRRGGPGEADAGAQGDAQASDRVRNRGSRPMKLSELSIQRPVFATVMSLSIIILG
jgi:hypothetical protein